MTVGLEQLRAHVGPGPSDDVLEDSLAAALEAIDNRYGPASETCREYLRPFGQWVKLGRRASAIGTVIEGGTTVAASGYALWPGGRYVRRLDTSGKPALWTGWVDITSTPLSEIDERERVIYALVDLDLSKPASGLTGITVGPWSEQYNQSSEGYSKLREAILDSMRPRLVGTW